MAMPPFLNKGKGGKPAEKDAKGGKGKFPAEKFGGPAAKGKMPVKGGKKDKC